jgi:hypothetical protein
LSVGVLCFVYPAMPPTAANRSVNGVHLRLKNV